MSAITLPKPVAVNGDTVVFAKADWNAYVEQLEDRDDIQASQQHDAWATSVGPDEARRLSYSADEAERIIDGAPPLTIWRERAGLSQRALAEKAGVSSSYLAEVEGGKKPGSVSFLGRVARVLSVPMEMLCQEAV